jgi:hypothetical protein
MVAASAQREEILALIRHTDSVVEIQNTLTVVDKRLSFVQRQLQQPSSRPFGAAAEFIFAGVHYTGKGKISYHNLCWGRAWQPQVRIAATGAGVELGCCAGG